MTEIKKTWILPDREDVQSLSWVMLEVLDPLVNVPSWYEQSHHHDYEFPSPR